MARSKMLAKRPRAEKRGVNDLSPTHVAAEEGKADYLHLLGEYGKNAFKGQDRSRRAAGWLGRAELLAKKGRIVGGVGCPPNCRTSGKLRGSSGKLREAPGSSGRPIGTDLKWTSA